MKKRITALTLAAIMLCSCSANVTEENATTTAIESVTESPKATTRPKTTTAAETTEFNYSKYKEGLENAIEQAIENVINEDPSDYIDDILNIPDESTANSPDAKQQNYYESYDVLHKCTYPTKSNNGTFCVNTLSYKTRKYFLDPSFIDYYYEYDIGGRDSYLIIDNYIYYHKTYDRELQLLRYDTYTGKTYSVNSINLDTMEGETNYTLGDDNMLYAITLSEEKYVDTDSNGELFVKVDYIHSLESIDLETLSSKKLFDFERNIECEILAVYNNKAYIGKRERDSLICETSIYELDLNTKAESKIFEASYSLNTDPAASNWIGIYKNKPYIFYTESNGDKCSLYMSETNGKKEMLYSSQNWIRNLYIIDDEIYFELDANSAENIVYKIKNNSTEFVGFSDLDAYYIFKDPYSNTINHICRDRTVPYGDTFISPLEK